jgi:hypothetical protein
MATGSTSVSGQQPAAVANVTLPTAVVHGPGFRPFLRASIVTVGTVQIQNVGAQKGLAVVFDIKSSLRPKEPNTCDLKIWNLSPASRKAIEQASQVTTSVATAPGTPSGLVPVQIQAGYVGHMSTVFLGEMRSAQTTRDGADFVTELNSGDGDQALQLARINQHLPAGSTATAAIQAILAVMGPPGPNGQPTAVGPGNLMSSSVQQILKGATVYQKGVTLKGAAMDHLRDLTRSVGLEVSIQGGVAQFLTLGQPLAGEAYLLSAGDAASTTSGGTETAASNTGLIGTPTVDTKGVLSCQSLILPGIKVGGPIQIDAMEAQGLYRVVSTDIKGETHGQDWSISIEAQRYGTAVV